MRSPPESHVSSPCPSEPISSSQQSFRNLVSSSRLTRSITPLPTPLCHRLAYSLVSPALVIVMSHSPRGLNDHFFFSSVPSATPTVSARLPVQGNQPFLLDSIRVQHTEDMGQQMVCTPSLHRKVPRTRGVGPDRPQAGITRAKVWVDAASITSAIKV